MRWLAAVLGVGLSAASGQDAARQDAVVRMNQVQVIGTHNSYHAGFAPGEAALMREKNREAFESLDYSHPPLEVQLGAGVRQLEIDVYADTKGGRFAHPAITGWVKAAGLAADPELDPGHELEKPGFKVMHVVGVDQRSTCMTLVGCLRVVRGWSVAHPGHLPVYLLIETKYDAPKATPRAGAVEEETFTPAVFDALDAEIRSVFAEGEMITPDRVRGTHGTLREAVAAGGWPTLAESRGKVVFLMDQAGMSGVYAEGHPGLRGRVLFTNAEPGTADAAFVEKNDGTAEEIGALVKQGYLVRTRTDEPTKDARANATVRRERALGSGAQILSTDYPENEPARWEGHYHVELPGHRFFRCDPVVAPLGCRDELLEP